MSTPLDEAWCGTCQSQWRYIRGYLTDDGRPVRLGTDEVDVIATKCAEPWHDVVIHEPSHVERQKETGAVG